MIFNWKYFIYFILIVTVAFCIYYFSPYAQSYWMIAILLALSLIKEGNTFSQRILLIAATGSVIAITSLLASLLAPSAFVLALYLFFLIAGGTWVNQSRNRYFFPTLLIGIFTIFAAIHSVPWSQEVSRLLFTMAATIIVLICQLLFWRNFFQYEINCRTQVLLRQLRFLTQEIFFCFLQPEYATNLYLFERRLHVKKKRFMQAFIRLRVIQANSVIILKLEKIYDILLDCAQLRRRVKDYHLFSLCLTEFKAISEELNKLFTTLSFTSPNSTADLEQTIYRLEETYLHVLQVTSPDPIVFLFFLSSLKELCKEVA